MAHGCIYCTDDFHCEKFTDEKHTSWCYGKDYPCKDRRITNADRIRSMTDEELAKWLAELEVEASEECSLDEYHNPGIVNDWLEWLKEEAGTDAESS